MGNIAFCDCLDVRKEGPDEKFEALEKQRIEAARKLFYLTDLNGDGLITADEFALMGLCKTKAHTEKELMPYQEQMIKNVFMKKYAEEIDACLEPVRFPKFKDYIFRSVNSMDPGDMQALEGFSFWSMSSVVNFEEASRGCNDAGTSGGEKHPVPQPINTYIWKPSERF